MKPNDEEDFWLVRLKALIFFQWNAKYFCTVEKRYNRHRHLLAWIDKHHDTSKFVNLPACMYHSNECSVHGVEVHYVSHWENKLVNLLAKTYHTEIVIKLKQRYFFLLYIYSHQITMSWTFTDTISILWASSSPTLLFDLLVEISHLGCNFQYRWYILDMNFTVVTSQYILLGTYCIT